MSTITNQELSVAMQGLGQLANMDLPGPILVQVYRHSRKANEHWQDVNKARTSILKRHSKLDENDEIVPQMDEDGKKTDLPTWLSKDDERQATKELESLMDEPYEFSKPISLAAILEHLPKGRAAVLVMLGDMLVDDAEEEVADKEPIDIEKRRNQRSSKRKTGTE